MQKLRPYEERKNLVHPVLSQNEQVLLNALRAELWDIKIKPSVELVLLTEHRITGNSGYIHRFFYANLSEKIGTIWGKTDTRYWYVWYLYTLGDYYSAIEVVGKYDTEKDALTAMRKSL